GSDIVGPKSRGAATGSGPPRSTGGTSRRSPATAGEVCVDRTRALRELLSRQGAVLDGAWGTMLQGAKLSPTDYRSDRFADHPRDLTGNPDILNLTRPDLILDVHRR